MYANRKGWVELTAVHVEVEFLRNVQANVALMNRKIELVGVGEVFLDLVSGRPRALAKSEHHLTPRPEVPKLETPHPASLSTNSQTQWSI